MAKKKIININLIGDSTVQLMRIYSKNRRGAYLPSTYFYLFFLIVLLFRCEVNSKWKAYSKNSMTAL